MGIQSVLVDLGKWLLSLGIGASALCYLGKKLIDQFAATNLEHVRQELLEALETHKAQLTLQATTEIERLKSELQIDAHRQAVGYASLHAKRGEVIAQAYAALALLDEAAARLLFQMQRRKAPGWSQEALEKDYENYPLSKEEKKLCEDINREYQSFRIFFRSNRIYLPKGVAAKTDHVAFSFHILADHYEFNGAWYEAGDPEVYEQIRTTIESMSSRISALLPLVEDEFRSLLSGAS